MRKILFAYSLIATVLLLSACDNGTTCLEQQQRGFVSSGDGNVDVGEWQSVLVPYDSRGSQNDVQVSWPNKAQAGGPILQIYATSADCKVFDPKKSACQSIGARQGTVGPNGEPIVDHITLGPEQLYGASQYRLHIGGDARQSSDYAYTVTWFYGPDC